MIQRIQTIWLLLASVCAFLTLSFSFYSGHKIGDPQKIFTVLNAKSNLILLILTVGTGISSLILIFLYKDRKLQMRITLATIVAAIINLVIYFMQSKSFVPAESSFDLTCIFAFAVPVLLMLAFRGIYKDQKLVKSVDRLR